MSLTPEEFKAVIKSKGWTLRAVAGRWGITDVWIYNIAANAERASHYDDAVFGLPSRNNASRLAKQRKRSVSRLIGETPSGYRAGDILTANEVVGTMAEIGDRAVIVNSRFDNGRKLYLVLIENGASDRFSEPDLDTLFAQSGLSDQVIAKGASEDDIEFLLKARKLSFGR